MIVKENRISLATPSEQRAMGGKLICPMCNHKTFVPYLDENRNIIDERVGRCERVNNCTYHYPPREYFADNKRIGIDVPQRRPSRPTFRPQPKPTYIPPEIFKQSVIATKNHRNNLVEFLKTKFDADIVRNMVTKYFIGTSKHFNGGATVFYQIDRYGRVHRGKAMQYNPTTGKRVKDKRGNAKINWVHILLNLGGNLPPQCLFGEHLLPDYPDATVAIVESEKTAIIASVRFNDYIVLACGGCGNLSAEMCVTLRGRDVVLFPDNGKFNEWRDKGKELRHLFRKLYISDIMEREAKNDGDDIGDLFLYRDPNLPTIDFNLTEL